MVDFSVVDGEFIKVGEPELYKDFTISFDFCGDGWVDFVLILENVVTAAEYDEMPDDTRDLLDVLIESGTFILSNEPSDDTLTGFGLQTELWNSFEDFFFL